MTSKRFVLFCLLATLASQTQGKGRKLQELIPPIPADPTAENEENNVELPPIFEGAGPVDLRPNLDKAGEDEALEKELEDGIEEVFDELEDEIDDIIDEIQGDDEPDTIEPEDLEDEKNHKLEIGIPTKERTLEKAGEYDFYHLKFDSDNDLPYLQIDSTLDECHPEIFISQDDENP